MWIWLLSSLRLYTINWAKLRRKSIRDITVFIWPIYVHFFWNIFTKFRRPAFPKFSVSLLRKSSYSSSLCSFSCSRKAVFIADLYFNLQEHLIWCIVPELGRPAFLNEARQMQLCSLRSHQIEHESSPASSKCTSTHCTYCTMPTHLLAYKSNFTGCWSGSGSLWR